jgi:DNA polymerase III delta prime subunit
VITLAVVTPFNPIGDGTMAIANINSVKVTPPHCLNDFALQQNSRFKLESILDATLSFPDNGVNGIILHGLYGTGKTTMANLLPGLIETAKTDPNAQTIAVGDLIDTTEPAQTYYPCTQGQNGVGLINNIQNGTSFVAWNASGLHYVILDEVDLLTDAAKASFKALMNRTNVVFIMTTNHLNEVDPGVQNRSVLVDMNVPPAAHWRPILRRIYTQSGLVAPPDATLDQVVLAGRGSARSIFSDVVMSANQARKAGQSNVIRINNIRS